MNVLRILDLTKQPILGGAVQGENLLALLVSAARPHLPCEILCFDFDSIEIATSSFLRASVLAFRLLLLERGSVSSIVLANVNDSIREELAYVLQAQGDAIVCCCLRNGVVSDPVVIGRLDDMQMITLNAVLAIGEPVEARTLAEQLDRESLAEGKRITKWNNRLSALSRSGLLSETSRGRIKYYTPILNGLKNGT